METFKTEHPPKILSKDEKVKRCLYYLHNSICFHLLLHKYHIHIQPDGSNQSCLPCKQKITNEMKFHVFLLENDQTVISELTQGKSANITFLGIIRGDTTIFFEGRSSHDKTGLKATIGAHRRRRSYSVDYHVDIGDHCEAHHLQSRRLPFEDRLLPSKCHIPTSCKYLSRSRYIQYHGIDLQ